MRKAQIIGSLSHFIGEPETHTLENRIFNAVMILLSLAGALTTTYNLILNNQIEKYLSEHSEAKLSHGICPDCVARLYPYIRN
jgi:hypothetical protein